MVSITLKDIPDQLHRALKQRARMHHRSLNKEVIATIESAILGTEGNRGVTLGSGKGLITRRPSDESLVKMDFGTEWEMNR
jgi:plasmid stability protein